MVDKKKKLKQQEAEPKRAENTTMAAPKCATEKKFRHLCRKKVIDVLLIQIQKRVQQKTVELTTLRPEASSGKRNERQDEKSHAFMEKK